MKNNQWLLLISPWESITDNWEVKLFNTEEELLDYKSRHDYTKEHYWMTAKDFSELCQKVDFE